MTLAAACGWSLVRSLVVALAAWPICKSQVAWLAGMERRQRRLAWLALLIPFLCPELWAGYAWSGFGVRLANSGLWSLFPFGLLSFSPQAIVTRDAAVDELLLDLLLFFRAVPVGTVAMFFAPPPPLSREAMYCRKLARVPRATRTRSANECDESLPRSRFGLVWDGINPEVIVPLSGCSKPTSRLRSDVLPAPECPRTAVTPGSISSETSIKRGRARPESVTFSSFQRGSFIAIGLRNSGTLRGMA